MQSAFSRARTMAAVCLMAAVFGVNGSPAARAQYPGANHGWTRLRGHLPSRALADARRMARLAVDRNIDMALVLPLRNQQELNILLGRLYDPADPQHGHYLSPQEFNERFAPTQEDYDEVVTYARSMGLTVTGTHSNRLLVNVSGPAGVVENAFNMELDEYQARTGRRFYAPSDNPEVPEFMASRVAGVIGLNDANLRHANNRFLPAGRTAHAAPDQIGSGPGGGLTPTDIVTAYNLNSVAANGAGQTLALFELDGYDPNDVATYVSRYGLPQVPLENVLVDGVSGTPGSGASEVTLDIELMIAMAPGADRIIVYEGPNSSTGVVDTYNRIATENRARQVSTSWGLTENQTSLAVLQAENAIFQQMAAQGQTVFAASGDSGALNNGSSLSVDDPASQPYVIGTGGTRLFVNADRTYDRETTWNVNNTARGGAGGGGISTVWDIPSWQQVAASSTSMGSATMRNVPDVALDADPNTGYSVYYGGNWHIVGGTSCAAPLWAAFTARVNQQRESNGDPPLGFANPLLYRIAASDRYGTDFHDIADGSTNLYYAAVTGYDNATGCGSFNGINLFFDMVVSENIPVLPAPTNLPRPSSPDAPTGLTAAATAGEVMLQWNPGARAESYSVYRGTWPGGETLIASGITSTTYRDSGVAPGTTCFYTVQAVNSAGVSGSSNEVAITTMDASGLSITRGPDAYAGNYYVNVQWATNLPATTVIRYGTNPIILRKTASNTFTTASHSVTFYFLPPHTTYYFQVSDSVQGTTVSSTVQSFTTP